MKAFIEHMFYEGSTFINSCRLVIFSSVWKRSNVISKELLSSFVIFGFQRTNYIHQHKNGNNERT